MEFCENSTLRSAIDDGLFKDKERMWRLFREIIEGLVHIHQQVKTHFNSGENSYRCTLYIGWAKSSALNFFLLQVSCAFNTLTIMSLRQSRSTKTLPSTSVQSFTSISLLETLAIYGIFMLLLKRYISVASSLLQHVGDDPGFTTIE